MKPLDDNWLQVLVHNETDSPSALGRAVCCYIDVDPSRPYAIASQIAELLNETLLAGHKQGVASVRRALGMND